MIEESSWFGTQLQSISKERLLPTRDSLLGIIRRKERPLNSGIYETYGSHVHGTSCLQNWLCGLAHGTVNIRNHKSPEFPQQRKRPCLRIASLEVSSWKRPWVSSSATCAFSTFHSLPSPTSSSSSSPPSPLILDVDISVGLTVINDASANPSRGKRPSPWQRPARDPQAALDNGTDHISMRETKGSWFFFFFAPERLEELLLYQIMLHSKAWKRNKPSSIHKAILEMLSYRRDPLETSWEPVMETNTPVFSFVLR